MLHPHVAASQSSGYSKPASRDVYHKPSAPDWLWSEHRRLLPTVFAEIKHFLVALLLWMRLRLILVTMHIAPTFAVLAIPSCLRSTLAIFGLMHLSLS